MEAVETRAPAPFIAALVEQAAAGDRGAYGRLVERHWAGLVRLARSVVGEAEAEDVVQDSLVSAWDQLSRLRRPERFPAWITRTVVRACLRRSRRWRGRIDLAELPEPRTTPNPDDDIDLQRLLARLAPRQRAVLHLTVVEGRSDREIAEAMGISAASVRSHRRRAREALQRHLDRAPLPEPSSEGGTLP